MKTLPQLRGPLVVLLIQSKQVRGQVHHSRAVFLHVPTQQSLYESLLYPPILIQKWKEPHGGTVDGSYCSF
jgi:hypothetical protein